MPSDRQRKIAQLHDELIAEAAEREQQGEVAKAHAEIEAELGAPARDQERSHLKDAAKTMGVLLQASLDAGMDRTESMEIVHRWWDNYLDPPCI